MVTVLDSDVGDVFYEIVVIVRTPVFNRLVVIECQLRDHLNMFLLLLVRKQFLPHLFVLVLLGLAQFFEFYVARVPILD